MKKEKIILYESTETIFTHNGIRVLKPLQCTINRNLVDYTYDLDMVYPIDDTGYWKDIIEDRIIKANGQLFRIVHTDKSVIDNSITIYAKHIFFDLQKNFIEDANVVVKNGNIALSQLLGATSFQHNFTGYSDIAKQNNFRCVRQNVLDALLGDQDNSFINRWGGEFDVDNFNIKMVNRVGSDKGYKIKYGRNLTGLNFRTDYTNIVTRIRPVGFDGIDLGDNNYVDSPNINNYSMPIIREMKYEHVKWSGSPNYEAPDENDKDDNSVVFDDLELARAELRRLAGLAFTSLEVDLPEINCEVNFIELSNTEEYSQFRNLEKISLGDIVTIEHKPLDIDIKARCISYVYDCLKQQYESIEIGHYQKNFFRETLNTNEKMENNDFDISEEIQSVYAQAISKMTEMMNNSMNGYVVLTNSEILIMDSPDKNSAKNVWKFNSSGIAHSSTGYEGDYTVGMTMDGHINGALITARTIKGDMLEVGTITTRELAVEIQTTINSAMTQETTQALITANIDGFKSELSKTYATQENVTKQIENSTTEAIEQALQNVDNQFDDYTKNTLSPYLKTAIDETFQNSKDYVTQVTGDYYTKSEVDSSISQTRDEIQLHLSESYETKENTSIKIAEAIDGVNVGAINRVFGTAEEKSFTFNGESNHNYDFYEISTDISDKEVIVSFEYDLEATVENGSRLRYETRYISTSNIITYNICNILSWNSPQTISLKNQKFSFKTTHHAMQQDAFMRIRSDGVKGIFKIRKAQIKVGNKVTEWSVAPEDIESNANNYTIEQLKSYYTKEETISEISQTKEQIKLELSNTFLTQEDVATQIKDASENAVEQATKEIVDNAISKSLASVDSQLSGKLTDYTTNTLVPSLDDALEKSKKYTTEIIEDYYTKEEVSSAIELTREQIQLGVSENYETKANVEIKIKENVDNLSIGGRNIVLNSAPSVIKETKGWKLNGNGSLSLVDEKTAPEGKVIKWVANIDGVNGFYNNYLSTEVVAGKKYSSSVYIKASRAIKMRVGCEKGGYKTVDVTTNWQKITNTFIANSSTYHAFCFYKADSNNNFKTGDIVYVHSVKLEEGDKPTSWTYAPEDINSDIINAKNDAIDYTNTIIADYYTKEETKSEITQTKESIELGVSQKYETKANVQSKINGVSTQITNEITNGLNNYTTNTLNPAITTAKNNVLQNSKNYTTEVVKNYYKKSEVDSKISQTKESIELGVSQKYETKENSSVKISEAINGVNVGAINRVFGTAEEKSFTFNGESNHNHDFYEISTDITNKEVIISFEYDLEATVENGSRLRYETRYTSTSNETKYVLRDILSWKSNQKISLKNQKFSFKTTHSAMKQDAFMRIRSDGVKGTFKIRKAQIKVGNKITEWSIAPEDIEENANNYTIKQLKSYYTKTQTDSLIKATKDEINLGVSSTYETKTNVTTKVNNAITTAKNDATTKMNNAINNSTTKVNNALTEAKNDATTKANNAKKDAINHTNSVIANYYTKEQTKSQINIAKESIESTVSKTYATKLDFENMSIGGENLLPNSNFAYQLSKWSTSEPQPTKNPNATNKSMSILNNGNGNTKWADPTINTLQIKATNLPDRYGVQSNAIKLQANTEYVISGYCAGHRIGSMQINIRDMDNNASNISTVNYNPVSGGNSLSKYYYFEHVFKTSASTKFAINLYGTKFGDDGYVWFANIKLEKGNKATSWSPCEEDYKLYTDQTTTQISSELGDLSKIVSDNTGSDSITSAMKKKLISEYNDAIAVYDKLYNMYSVLGDKSFNNLPTELNTAKKNLTSAISPLESSINKASESGLSGILDKFNVFYSLAEELTQAITNALTGLTKENQTQIEQLTSDVKIKISEIKTVGDKVNELYTHFTFAKDGLTIKSSQNATKTVKLDNDSLDFMDNNTVVAKITDKQLLINEAEVENQMRIGNILIKPSGVGGIMFIYE